MGSVTDVTLGIKHGPEHVCRRNLVVGVVIQLIDKCSLVTRAPPEGRSRSCEEGPLQSRHGQRAAPQMRRGTVLCSC